jgi:hypothetical protein
MAEGLTAAGLERLHAAAAQHVGDDRVPGLVALAARGGQVHVEALGELTVGGMPVTGDSICLRSRRCCSAAARPCCRPTPSVP